MKLLWLGSPFFSSVLAAALTREAESTGNRHTAPWNVAVHNFEDVRVYGWEDICRLAGGAPDILVVADKSRTPFVTGMERFPCLTVFYCVDSHIHSWYPLYAQGFDLCLLSLAEHRPRFERLFLSSRQVWDSPPFAWEEDLPGAPDPALPAWEALFVGTVDPERTPGRVRFLRALKERVPGLQVMQGAYRRLYPNAKVVLNYCELGDLNFRVFEALGCGAALVTPLVGHGLTRLFTPDQDMLCYAPDAVESAARAITAALSHDARRERMARSGLARVNAGHRARHRAAAFARRLFTLGPAGWRALAGRRLRAASSIHRSCLRPLYLLLAEALEESELQKRYLEEAKSR